MKSQTKQELSRCLEFLKRSDISEADRQAAERGALDWFCQSIFDDFSRGGVEEKQEGHAHRPEKPLRLKVREGSGDVGAQFRSENEASRNQARPAAQ